MKLKNILFAFIVAYFIAMAGAWVGVAGMAKLAGYGAEKELLTSRFLLIFSMWAPVTMLFITIPKRDKPLPENFYLKYFLASFLGSLLLAALLTVNA